MWFMDIVLDTNSESLDVTVEYSAHDRKVVGSIPIKC